MAETAALAKEDDDEKSGTEKKPLWWGLAAGVVILSVAVAYKIVKSDGNVDFQGGMDGIQVKISQAQKTIASAQQEVADAQKQLDEREAQLKTQQQALQEREAKVQELLASLDKTETSVPRKLTAAQVQTEIKKLRAAPPVAAAGAAAPASAKPMKASIDKLTELRESLDKTNGELKAAAQPAAAP